MAHVIASSRDGDMYNGGSFVSSSWPMSIGIRRLTTSTRVHDLTLIWRCMAWWDRLIWPILMSLCCWTFIGLLAAKLNSMTVPSITPSYSYTWQQVFVPVWIFYLIACIIPTLMMIPLQRSSHIHVRTLIEGGFRSFWCGALTYHIDHRDIVANYLFTVTSLLLFIMIYLRLVSVAEYGASSSVWPIWPVYALSIILSLQFWSALAVFNWSLLTRQRVKWLPVTIWIITLILAVLTITLFYLRASSPSWSNDLWVLQSWWRCSLPLWPLLIWPCILGTVKQWRRRVTRVDAAAEVATPSICRRLWRTFLLIIIYSTIALYIAAIISSMDGTGHPRVNHYILTIPLGIIPVIVLVWQPFIGFRRARIPFEDASIIIGIPSQWTSSSSLNGGEEGSTLSLSTLTSMRTSLYRSRIRTALINAFPQFENNDNNNIAPPAAAVVPIIAAAVAAGGGGIGGAPIHVDAEAIAPPDDLLANRHDNVEMIMDVL
jgi:hypothetical protein